MNNELNNFQFQESKTLPNATAVLVLGILSIIMCWTYGILGLIMGVIALVLHKKDKKIYLTNPALYEESFKNSNAGKICAIIGVSLSILSLIYLVFIVLFLTVELANGVSSPEFREVIDSIEVLKDSLKN